MLSTAKYSSKMAFEITQDEHKFFIDAYPEHGGENRGPSPKGLLLSSLIGCTGMDVVSILNKMHAPFESLEISAEADFTTDHPKVFKDITVKFILTGQELDLDKVKRAVGLSMEKYCGVSAMLRKNSEILPEIYFNGVKQD
jgi:putative redox protein